jgi:hypothetical protein
MLFNDLFESDREPYQQAIDRLEMAHINNLNAKMDAIIGRVNREKLTDEHKAALKKEYIRLKAERDSIYGIKDGTPEFTVECDAEGNASVIDRIGQAIQQFTAKKYGSTAFDAATAYAGSTFKKANLDDIAGWANAAARKTGPVRLRPVVKQKQNTEVVVSEWRNTAPGADEEQRKLKKVGIVRQKTHRMSEESDNKEIDEEYKPVTKPVPQPKKLNPGWALDPTTKAELKRRKDVRNRVGVDESADSDKDTIAKVMDKVFVDGGGGNLSYMIELKAPTLTALRYKYHDDLDAMFARADKKELAQAAQELRAMYGQVEEGWSDASVSQINQVNNRISPGEQMDAIMAKISRERITDPDVLALLMKKYDLLKHKAQAQGIEEAIHDILMQKAMSKSKPSKFDNDMPDHVKDRIQQMRDRVAAARQAKDPQHKTVDEGWSDAIVAQRTGRPRTPYAVYIKGKKWKDFENDDHAEAVANKLKAKFKQEGRDPSVITIAPADISEGLLGKLAQKAMGPLRVNNAIRRHERASDAAAERGDWAAASKEISRAGKIDNRFHPSSDEMEEGYHTNTIGAMAAAAPTFKPGDIIWVRNQSGEKVTGEVVELRPGIVVFQNENGKRYRAPEGRVVRAMEEGSMSDAEHHASGAKFGGYYGGTQVGAPKPGQSFGAESKEMDEAMYRDPGSFITWAQKQGDRFAGFLGNPNIWRAAQDAYNQEFAEGVAEAISKKDLVSKLQKDLPKVTDPKNKNAKPVKWTGPKSDEDYGYTGYQGHGMPADKKKGVTEGMNFMEWAVAQGSRFNNFAGNPEVYAQARSAYLNEDIYGGIPKIAKVPTGAMYSNAKLPTLKTNLRKAKEQKARVAKKLNSSLTEDEQLDEDLMSLFGEAQNIYAIYQFLKANAVPVALFVAAVMTYGLHNALTTAKEDESEFMKMAKAAWNQVDQGRVEKIVDWLNDKFITTAQKMKIGDPISYINDLTEKSEAEAELQPGQYYVWTVHFDDGTESRVKVTSDQFDPKAYYAKKNKVVIKTDYDWTIHG